MQKVETESELDISDIEESESSSSEEVVKYIHKKKKLHKKRKVKKAPVVLDSTGTSDSESDSDTTPPRKKRKYKKKVCKECVKEKESPTVNLADLDQLQQAAAAESSPSVLVDLSQLSAMIQYVQ